MKKKLSMSEPHSISKDLYEMIQQHAHQLSHDTIKNQKQHLNMLENIVKVAQEDWKRKNEN